MTKAKERWEERERRARVAEQERTEKRRSGGQHSARERLEALFDPGSFQEIDRLVEHRATSFGLNERRVPGDGVVTGFGTIEGRPVAAFAQDRTVFGGALGEAHASKIVKMMEYARKSGIPLIGLNDGGGARIQEGVAALGGYGEVFFRNVILSGVVPQISVILGPCAGGAVYSPAITDFVVMVRGQGQMFITGPDVIRSVTGESVTAEELGGADTHGQTSGVSQFTVDSEEAALQLVRRLLSYLPSNNLDAPLLAESREPPGSAATELAELVPEAANAPYDVREVISRVVDSDSWLEVAPAWGANLVVGFARLGGRAVGVVANQPKVLAGTLDISASTKGARFVRCCDAFGLPLLTFVDVPGFLPGTAQELGGIIRHGAKLLYAFAEATVPKLTVILRKAYGGAYVVMCSKHLGGDYNVAWPQAEIAVMGAEGAVNILFRRELETAPATDREALRKRHVEEYEAEFLNPHLAAERGFLDAVIDPANTRAELLRALAVLAPKREERPGRKHGNLPL